MWERACSYSSESRVGLQYPCSTLRQQCLSVSVAFCLPAENASSGLAKGIYFILNTNDQHNIIGTFVYMYLMQVKTDVFAIIFNSLCTW